MTGYIMVKMRGGRKRLMKKRPGPSRSMHLYGARRGVLRSTLSCPSTRSPDMFINTTTGDKVRLTSHDTDATFEPWEGGEPQTVTSNEFFTAHREATQEEIDAATGETYGATTGPEDAPAKKGIFNK